MANRWSNQFGKTLEKEVNTLFARVTFNGSSAPTVVRGKGFLSITRTSTGVFSVKFGVSNSTNGNQVDTYNTLLGFNVAWDATTTADTATGFVSLTTNTVSTTGILVLTFAATQGGSAADPTTGSQAFLSFQLCNSSAP